MICVRCLCDTAEKVAAAPDGSGAWVMHFCKRCNYSWRCSEGPEITDISRRNPEFQMDGVDLDSLLNPVPVPPLEKHEK